MIKNIRHSKTTTPKFLNPIIEKIPLQTKNLLGYLKALLDVQLGARVINDLRTGVINK